MISIEPSPDDRNGYRLTSEQRLPTVRNAVFDFFSDASQLQRLTPPWLHFVVQTPSPIEMAEGTLIDYRLRLRGIPLRWRSNISVWEPPEKFVDEQLIGPYRYWRHQHIFLAEDDATVVRDIVDYAVPGGRFIHWLTVRSDVTKIFTYRQQQLRSIFARDSSYEDAGQGAVRLGGG